MNIAKLLEQRRLQWTELERLCGELEVRGRTQQRSAAAVSRFATLYRSACADLALATAYQLPPATVAYLHRLVGRAHNQLYRSGTSTFASWVDIVIRQAPQRIFSDPCVRVAALLFFGLFTLSMLFAWNETLFPQFAETVLGAEHMTMMESSFEEPLDASMDHYLMMSGFYIQHNTGIGLQCFAFGILLIPCLVTLSYNAVVLGASFGYMARDSVAAGDNFFQFVTAHGPFELTAIALSAGAGLRMGLGLFATGGLRRVDSLRLSALKAVPIMAAAVVMFFLAAFTEGFISPSPLPYVVKAAWAILSSGLLMFYFVVLGFPRRGDDAA
ncbi:stage II sporulation protein M [Candidatus Laterigemmans baculatus]|uniref:stage II sporulation protein M n=1 Tax=Candidatus Laterigemmans baculatus TaxID=2770505 RepID=UPI0013DB8848|nr:stage II sporulation protein M [Candidatus Laterigemmans baculatus]